MIDHSACSHPRTPKDRAKCRKLRAQQGFHPPLYSLGPPPKARKKGATAKRIDADDNYGQTPARRDMECHKCGVERIAYRGTDPISGILLYVGERCYWYIKNSPDREPVEHL